MMNRFPSYDCLRVENFIWYSDSEVVPLSLSFSKFCHVALSWIKLDKVLDAVSSSTNRISSHPSHTSLYSKRSLCWINFIHYTCIHSNLLIAKLLLKPFTMQYYVYYIPFHLSIQHTFGNANLRNINFSLGAPLQIHTRIKTYKLRKFCQSLTHLMQAASVSMLLENIVTVCRAGTLIVLMRQGLLVSRRDLSQDKYMYNI